MNKDDLKDLEYLNDEMEPETINLTFEDGTEAELVVLDIFDLEDKSYIALVDEDGDPDEVFFYEYKELDDDEIELENIENKEELNKVLDVFEEIYFEEGELNEN
ncbi:DUF1292 domain-containing protein [Peptoniphilus catoniae]|uniref:DUF1292 domain-containing protein n=1 Tax=Peptoniphilus catoniae TaxID=1660341 RepID=UPI0010FF5187|nr:DUF1292 domain-containing protein [Peptoniphilus catoniae]